MAYCIDHGQYVCRSCDPGFYLSGIRCEKCSIGTWSKKGEDICKDCEEGYTQLDSKTNNTRQSCYDGCMPGFGYKANGSINDKRTCVVCETGFNSRNITANNEEGKCEKCPDY